MLGQNGICSIGPTASGTFRNIQNNSLHDLPPQAVEDKDSCRVTWSTVKIRYFDTVGQWQNCHNKRFLTITEYFTILLNQYNLRRPLMAEVLSTRIWGVPRLVGRYCSYLLSKQAGGTPQILVDKTSSMSGRLRVYISFHFPRNNNVCRGGSCWRS